jgi:hypothetical protein
MDSHGSCFGPFAASARVGAGEGADLAASGSCASVSGRRVCRTRLVITFGGIARHGIPGKLQAAALWHAWLKR